MGEKGKRRGRWDGESERPRSTGFWATKTDGFGYFSVTYVNSKRAATLPSKNTNREINLSYFKIIKHMSVLLTRYSSIDVLLNVW